MKNDYIICLQSMVAISLTSSALAATGRALSDSTHCTMHVDVKATLIRPHSVGLEWTIPKSCDSESVVQMVAEDNMRYGPCKSPGTFDFKAAKPVFDPSDPESEAGTFSPAEELHSTTLSDLGPDTQYCFGFTVETASPRHKFGPFIVTFRTKPDVPAVLSSSRTISGFPEMEFKYHDEGIEDLEVVEASLSKMGVKAFVDYVRKKHAAVLLSSVYTTNRCGYSLHLPAQVRFRYNPHALPAADESLVIFESKPPLDISSPLSAPLSNQHIDKSNHMVTAETHTLNCPPINNSEALASHFALFSVKKK